MQVSPQKSVASDQSDSLRFNRKCSLLNSQIQQLQNQIELLEHKLKCSQQKTRVLVQRLTQEQIQNKRLSAELRRVNSLADSNLSKKGQINQRLMEAYQQLKTDFQTLHSQLQLQRTRFQDLQRKIRTLLSARSQEVSQELSARLSGLLEKDPGQQANLFEEFKKHIEDLNNSHRQAIQQHQRVIQKLKAKLKVCLKDNHHLSQQQQLLLDSQVRAESRINKLRRELESERSRRSEVKEIDSQIEGLISQIMREVRRIR